MLRAMLFSPSRMAVRASCCMLFTACGGDDAERPIIPAPAPAHGLPDDAVISELTAAERASLCEDSARRLQVISGSREGRCTRQAREWSGFRPGEECEMLREECLDEGPADDESATPKERCEGANVDVPGPQCAITVAKYARCVAERAAINRVLFAGCRADVQEAMELPYSCGDAKMCGLFTE
jgi:hypothetical protein